MTWLCFFNLLWSQISAHIFTNLCIHISSNNFKNISKHVIIMRAQLFVRKFFKGDTLNGRSFYNDNFFLRTSIPLIIKYYLSTYFLYILNCNSIIRGDLFLGRFHGFTYFLYILNCNSKTFLCTYFWYYLNCNDIIRGDLSLGRFHIFTYFWYTFNCRSLIRGDLFMSRLHIYQQYCHRRDR
ncbi:hypothetical protein CgunFtcFv8_001079 [Champsocephalus gunnari]|uniref:Uncharacterized protein n=1 Tax=Champsocephalus gunnari TaxID=52237 RepID=A0AAN8DL04_CHAGU|nr:hypothetical protein CgunFtcFv8_001079 [Champsocephalus gunnari]